MPSYQIAAYFDLFFPNLKPLFFQVNWTLSNNTTVRWGNVIYILLRFQSLIKPWWWSLKKSVPHVSSRQLSELPYLHFDSFFFQDALTIAQIMVNVENLIKEYVIVTLAGVTAIAQVRTICSFLVFQICRVFFLHGNCFWKSDFVSKQTTIQM